MPLLSDALARPARPRRAVSPSLWVGLLLALGVGALAACDPSPPSPRGDRSPYGELNLAWSSEPGTIGVVGWAKDPDVDRPIDVAIGVDGQVHRRTAGLFNQYLGGTHAQKYRAYLALVPARAGTHTVCAVAINVGPGVPFRLIGCSQVDVEPADPIGNAESFGLGADGSSVRATGWALDKDTVAPVSIDLTVGGAVAVRAVADVPRDDVAAAHRRPGSHHGYAVEAPVGPGRHQACVTANNVGRGGDTALGCGYVDVPDVLPRGNVDSIAVNDNRIAAQGWVGDPDAVAPIGVAVSVRRVAGIDDAISTTAASGDPRPDVAAAFGLRSDTGFYTTVPVTEAGAHEVCFTAVNVGRGRNQPLGCRTVDVADHRPVLTVDEVRPSAGGGVLVRGTAADPDHAGPVTVKVKVGSHTHVVSAAGGGREYSFSTTGLAAGRHSVCVTAIDQGGALPGVSGDRSLPCGAVVAGATTVGTTGAADASQAVAPFGTLPGIDRDGGVSARLRDGSVLWMFGDSSALSAEGSLRYFVAGSGGWAPAHAPGITTDPEDGGGAPYLLAAPIAGSPACGGSRPNQVMWPVSAVTVPHGSLDRVVVYLSNMCTGSGEVNFEFKGMAVAHWYYDPATPPVRQPIRLEILNPDLGTPVDRPYGSASTLGADGMLYTYTCGRPANLFDVANFGPCRVARVAPAMSAVLTYYEYWNGSGWVTNPNAAAAMTMPDGSAAGYDFPASAFTVTFDHVHGVYVMAYSPWPGFVDQVAVRVSTTPHGPWTPPVAVALDGCADTVGGRLRSCYAATAQPAFSTPGRLGLGFYDQSAIEDRRRGQYRVTSVPFVVER